MNNYASIKFARGQNEFFATLTQRVNQYFKTNNISKSANTEMIVKTICMFSFYLIPYFVLILSGVESVWIVLGLYALMGVGKAGIGLSVMHDANHGGYSSKLWVNKLLGFSMNMIGGSAFNWKLQHNVLHHTYTNVHEIDEDISPRGVLRMAPESKWHPMHRFQHWYAWFFYGLLTLVWILVTDYARLARYADSGLVAKQKASLTTEWVILIATKIFYVFYVVGIPMLVLPISFGYILIAFLLMHFISGFILSIIFQPAHVIEGTEYPYPDGEGNLENNWAIHQMHTTTNFAQRSKLFSWYVGGLNFQVEHHLFPQICHVHYRKIAPIVEATAREFGIPYKKKETFAGALAAHWRLMRELGKKPAVAIV